MRSADPQDEAVAMSAFRERQPSDLEYLRHVETLAQAVSKAAYEERGASSFKIEDAETPLQRAIAELAFNLRTAHHAGDGCVDDQ